MVKINIIIGLKIMKEIFNVNLNFNKKREIIE